HDHDDYQAGGRVSRPEARTCAVCGHVAETASEHSVHVTLAHPELNRAERVARRGRGEGSHAARPVSCWSCAQLIPAGTRTCVCGWTHPGFEPDRGVRSFAQELPDVADLDHRGRPR